MSDQVPERAPGGLLGTRKSELKSMDVRKFAIKYYAEGTEVYSWLQQVC